MKGVPGLMIAVGLGIVGAVCNWLYLSNRSRDLEKVGFVFIRSNAQLNPGDPFKEQHLERVDIPKEHLGNLDKVALKWDVRRTIIGYTAQRPFRGGELILNDDLRTPPQKDLGELLSVNEIGFPVPVDSRVFVAENFNPGEEVKFFTPGYTPGPTRAGTSSAIRSQSDKLVGPFRILALGNRRGSKEVEAAAGRRAVHENVMTVAIEFKDGKFDSKTEQLLELLKVSGNQGLQVVKLSSKTPPPK